MEGWFKLYRQMENNILWQDKPFAKGQAWIDLLLMANIADGDMLSKGVVVHIKRGQVFRTQKFLADRWGWSIKKVRGFLNLIEKQQMATVEGTAQGILITIEKYAFFQGEGQPMDMDEDSLQGNFRATSGQQNKKNKKEKIFTPPSVDDVQAYCAERNNGIDAEAFVDYYISTGWFIGKNKMKNWKAAVRTWERKQQGTGKQNEEKIYDWT